MASFALLSLLSFVAFTSAVQASILAGGWLVYCGGQAGDIPPGYIYACFESKVGPVTRTLDHDGTSIIFTDSHDPNKFAVALNDVGSTASFEVSGWRVEVESDQFRSRDGCVNLIFFSSKGPEHISNLIKTCPVAGPITITKDLFQS